MASSQTSAAERTRSFTGCRTCRNRHAKCDEGQPKCGNCQRLGLECEGYVPKLCWLNDDPVNKDEHRAAHRGSLYRFPLSSESERRLMTAKLVESVGKQNSTKLLADLDEACEKAVSHNGKCSVNLFKGPFGVFPAVESKPASSPSTATQTHPADQPSEAPGPVFDFDEDDALVENIHRDVDIGLIDPFDHDMLFNSTDRNFNFDLLDPALLDVSPSVKLPDGHLSALVESDILPQESMDLTFSPRPLTQLGSPPPPSLFISPGYSNANGVAIPEHAQPLLCYYKQCIDHTGKAFKPRRRSPGELLFLPCALETFAELSLWNTTSSARSALLYAVLANSAFQADRAALCQTKWRDIAVRHQAQAGRHLRDALLRETTGPSQVAYKDLLMAILAVAMISLFNGAHTFRSYLLDAEKLIRLRGLIEQKSTPIRLLHHMYTHLRIITESFSTEFAIDFGHDDNDSNKTAVSQARAFRTAENALNIGLDPAFVKTGDDGYNDIHLDVQGRWSKTMYPSIYNIPESLMTMLSQTISFANEKARLETIAATNPAVSASLTDHAKTLEGVIWSWELPEIQAGSLSRASIGLDDEDNNAHLESQHSRSMILAIHQALLIYFYRRVYNMNAMLLQDRVRQTLDYLEPCLTLEWWIEDQDFATSLAWSVFIAACEAVLPVLRQRALDILTTIDNRGIFFTSAPPTEVVTAIWQRREVLKAT
ncbi:hypothetical protein PFICI_02197 [Pestalotiopsis fici W106-1]|uniref:Zn(2)-C6 fungal-type domain-containing protein n=1 Tax=Pestalotiopsis fici (strain W106-1 / CGMCC3.15140) TaxID=1229662 RepID=W3XFG8_PESFW|nr:uncharacterized protein PFICI_02197 [Pestalotiopsis fici W106-1]ETS84172.1 hypothetical protein PFICI_02197 [Pestalotiopsis fici W106-1]